MEWIGFWIFWLAISVNALVGLLLGRERGRPGDGAAFGVLLGPLGWIVACFLSDLRWRCPECRREIPRGAFVCCHCHLRFRELELEPDSDAEPPEH